MLKTLPIKTDMIARMKPLPQSWSDWVSRRSPISVKPLILAVMPVALACVISTSPLLATQAYALTDDAQQLVEQGMVSLGQGAWTKALQQFQAANTLSPDDGNLHQVMAYAYSQMGQHRQAINHYRVAYQLNPLDTGTLMSLGHEHEALQEYPKALDAYASVLTKQPDYMFAHLAIGRLEICQQHWPQAIVALERFLSIYPQHLDGQRLLAQAYQANKQPDKAAAIYEELKMSFPKSFRDELPLARAHNQAGHPEKALRVLESSIATLPSGEVPSVATSTELGYSYLAMGQAGFAKKHFEQAYTQSPENPKAILGLAQAYLETSSPEKSIPLFQRYLREWPEDTSAQSQLVEAYIQTEAYDEAIALLRPLVDQPTVQAVPEWHQSLQAQLALALQRNSQLDESITLYKHMAMNAPSGTATQREVLSNLALAYHQKNDYAKAAALYDDVLSNSPANDITQAFTADAARAHLALADEALREGELVQAERELAMANHLVALPEAEALSVALLNAQAAATPVTIHHTNTPAEAVVPTGSVEGYLVAGQDPVLAKLNEAIAKWPNNPNFADAYVNRVLSSYPAKSADDPVNPELAKQLPQLDELLAKYPLINYPQLAVAHARLQAAHGDVNGAQSLLETRLSNVPATDTEEKAELHQWLAYWAELSGKSEKAKQHYEQLIAINDVSADVALPAWQWLASYYGNASQWEKAGNAYKQVLQLKPATPEALYGLAVTYDHQSKTDLAIGSYQGYLATGDTAYAPQVRQRLAILQPSSAQQPAKASEQPETTVSTTAAPMITVPVDKPMTVTVNGKKPININLNVGKVTMPATLPGALPAILPENLPIKLNSSEGTTDKLDASQVVPRYFAVTDDNE